MATSYDLNIVQGSSFNIRLSTKDSNANALNLSGYHVSGYIRNKYSDALGLLDLDPAIVSGQSVPTDDSNWENDAIFSGLIDVNLTALETAALPITQALYDIEIYIDNAETSVFKILNGKANIHPEATY
tara:strand:+ start:161 stop:547 length:387 start_codon:yes stop_codon:yes gene_type:complete